MKIGIIGAGFSGLAAAYELSKRNHQVYVFEKEEAPGGLAVGFKQTHWKWTMEKHYHHLFVSDWAIRNLAKEVGHKIIFKRPKTSVFIDGNFYQLDSALSLFCFNRLSLIDRLRVGASTFFLKITPFWKPLEAVTAESFLKKTMGEKSWRVLWQPLFEKKFGKYADKIPASWFWARVQKRSPQLGYPEGGFESFAKSIEKNVKKLGGRFFYGVEVVEISKRNGGLLLRTKNGKSFKFERIICTLPTPFFLKISKGLPEGYKKKIANLKGFGAVNLVLSLKKQFLKDKIYWLNINEQFFPFLGIVEQTNFIDPKVYGGDRIIYISNYLPFTHRYFQMSKGGLLNEFYPFLRKIRPNFNKSWIKKVFFFKAYFAQPIVPLNYSRFLLKSKTPIKGLYLANIQQVYPWDRGTNYAVELGEKVAKLIYTSRAE